MGTVLTKPRYYIAIDPDVKASGLAILDRAERKVQLCTKHFFELVEYIRMQANLLEQNGGCLVIVEDSWTKGTNWHVTRGKSMYYYASMGENVGRCHQVGILILEYCKTHGIQVQGVPPLQLRTGGRNFWHGRDGKITHEEFCEVTGYSEKRSNQEERDAGLLAWCNAGLPVKITPQKPLIERKVLRGIIAPKIRENAQKRPKNG